MVSSRSNPDTIKLADSRFFEALLKRDRRRLESLLANDFVIVEVAAGTVHARSAFLDAIDSGAVTFDAIETYPDEVLIREYGDVAVVIGRTTMSFRSAAGPAFQAGSRDTHVFRADGADWRLVSAQGTSIPNPTGSGRTA